MIRMHFYPRYAGDRFEGKPIDPKAVLPPVYSGDEFFVLRRVIAQALA